MVPLLYSQTAGKSADGGAYCKVDTYAAGEVEKRELGFGIWDLGFREKQKQSNPAAAGHHRDTEDTEFHREKQT